MKALIPLLLVLVSPVAHAAIGKHHVKLPTSAKLLFQTSGQSGFYGSSEYSVEAAAFNSARDHIRENLNSATMDGRTINVEYACQGVYYVWSRPLTADRGERYSSSVTVNVYCDPRDFQQKVAMSAMRACEKEPKPACLTPDYMNAFSKIQKTTYSDIYE